MKIFFASLLILLAFSLFVKSTLATSLDDCDQENIPTDKIGDCIDILSKKVGELGDQKKTLASQITQFDSQIKITQLKIADAQSSIASLEKEINVLGFRISYITQSVSKLEELLKKRIVATYQQSYVSNLELILSSYDFSELIQRVQYLRVVQENDKKLLTNLQQTKSNYAGQKDEREDKQAAIEDNKKKLEVLSASLDVQKAQKQALLEVTKNDESRFQQLLQQALAEKKAITAAFSDAVSRLNSGEGDSVSKDSAIALMGNSGAPSCSTGTHLHFTVLRDGSPQDPAQYLRDVSPGWDNSPDGRFSFSGSWDWPISNPAITQGFGMTFWAKQGFYNGSIHDGIDMTGGSKIAAPKDGKVIYGSISCGGNSLKYAALKHNDEPGIITLYLHIQ